MRAYDPEGMTAAAAALPDVIWCDDAYGAIDGADAMVVLTEWNQFRGLDLERVHSLLRRPVVADLRNIYEPGDMMAAGFSYSSIGRPVSSPRPPPRRGRAHERARRRPPFSPDRAAGVRHPRHHRRDARRGRCPRARPRLATLLRAAAGAGCVSATTAA